MQFGVFSVGDVTPDPTTGREPSEARADPGDAHDRPQGRGGRPRRVRHRRAPQPAVRAVLADDAARLPRRADRPAAAVHRDDADHHQRPGEDRRGLRDAAAPRRRPGRPDARPRQHRPGLPVVRPGHPRRHRAGRVRTTRCCAGCGARRTSTGRAGSAPRCRASPRRRARSTACRRSSGTARSGPRRSPSRPRTTATASSTTTSSGRRSTSERMVGLYRRRFEHYGHGPAEHAIVGLGGQVFIRHELARTRCASSGRTSTTPRCTGTARRWRSSWPRRR